MRGLLAFVLALTLGGLAAIVARGETFNLVDGSTLEGDLVSATEKGAIVKQPDGKYSDRVAWEKFSQENLKAIAKNPKFARYVQGLVIEDEPEVKKKKPAKPVALAKPVETKLDRPAKPGIIGGFFGSAVGWLVILALYAANIWAAYEIAIFRAQPVAVVCGAAAIVPIIPQLIYLSMPTRMPKSEGVPGEEGAGTDSAPAVDPHLASSLKIAHQTEDEVEKKGPVEPTIFKRGEFMFNRRFFESRFINFFTVVRRDKDKGTVLIIKTSRREYMAQRITRITANDMHIEVAKGSGNEEIQVSFTEIAEVQLRQGGH